MTSMTKVIALAGAALIAAGASGQTIYDNTVTQGDWITFSGVQLGDEVRPAGTARLVSQLRIGVTQDGFTGTADFQARLYANDGPDGEPGTLLWASPVIDDVPMTGDDQIVNFGVPRVMVPDTFTWTLEVTDAEPAVVGLPFYGPPDVGESPEHGWFGVPGDWSKLTLEEAPVDYMCLVVSSCRGDIDGDGDIDVEDLNLVLVAWGPCPGCLEDIDSSGEVGAEDLIFVLAEWGPCPLMD